MKAKGFTKQFGDRSGFICEGDSITCTVDGFDVTARVMRDDSADSPDKMQDGFWPSLDPKDAGYIGEKTPAQLTAAKRQASRIMTTWERDEWFYCGVIVTVSRCDVELAHESLWGIECNFPIGRKRANGYLVEVANDLLSEAISGAEDKLRDLLTSAQ